jgi:hypothetical protein
VVAHTNRAPSPALSFETGGKPFQEDGRQAEDLLWPLAVRDMPASMEDRQLRWTLHPARNAAWKLHRAILIKVTVNREDRALDVAEMPIEAPGRELA